ncbi:hypothetical protein [Chryseobacterium sp. 'Rf worker isolate 10']|uniref:hypothetical protein n=1 Tax=Chryseobacterium sp. 'Rf worker isolate 10' TaxID=2887348 RepID=UPI003D6F4678
MLIFNSRVEAGESLKNVCEKITGLTIETEASLKAKSIQFYELSVWVAKNKVKATKEKFDAKIKTYKDTPKPVIEIDSNIWDNLIYQVVTQKDFYAKETLMQFLHLDHILSNYDGVTEAQYEDVIKTKVVLPKELFSVKTASSNTVASREESSLQGIPFSDSALKFAEATVNLKGNEELKRTKGETVESAALSTFTGSRMKAKGFGKGRYNTPKNIIDRNEVIVNFLKK